MLDTVFLKTYPAPELSRSEILRYAGCKEENGALRELVDECLRVYAGVFDYRVCYRVLPARELLQRFDGEGTLWKSRLGKAEYAVVFAATVGLEIDRAILRESVLSPAKASILQALGAERIEALCDVFCSGLDAEWSKRGLHAGKRFSAGYGDFPLEAQKEIFALLNPERKIGLTLNENLLMTPTKSVTAIVPLHA